MKTARSIACVLALVAAGCSSTPGTTTPTPTVAPTSQLYTATLPVGGTVMSDAISVTAAGTGTLDLVSVTLTPTGPATATQLGIGIGPVNTGTDAAGNPTSTCTMTNSTVTAPALTSQLSVTVAVASYCVTVFDPGTLTAPVTFAVRFTHP